MLLAVTVTACGSRLPGPPLPRAVEPASASNLADVPVLLRGTGFSIVPLQHLGGGEPVTLRDDFRAWLGEQELSAVTYADEHTLSAVIPAGVAPGRHALRVQDPFGQTGVLEGAYEAIGHAALRGAATVSPTRVSVGQPFQLKLEVTNDGSVDAVEVLPSWPAGQGTGEASLVEARATALVPAAGAQTFEWTGTATRRGVLLFELAATGANSQSGEPIVMAAVRSNELVVDAPAALPARLAVDMRGPPGTVNVDQTITATLTVQNTGEAGAVGVAPSMLTLGGTSAATLLSGPSPASADIPAGGAQSFVWQARPTSVGTVTFTAQASGTDGNSGAPVSSSSALSTPVTVQRSAALSAAFTLPPRVNVGQLFTLTMQATNAGDSGAGAVTPSALTLGGTGGATLASGPTPASQSIPGAASRAFAWIYSPSVLGTLTFSGRASGTDLVSGTPVGSRSPCGGVQLDLLGDGGGDGLAQR